MKIQISQAMLKGQRDQAAYLNSRIAKAAHGTTFVLPEGEFALTAPLVLSDKNVNLVGGGGVPGLKTTFWTYHPGPGLLVTQKEVAVSSLVQGIRLGNALNENNSPDTNHGIASRVMLTLKDCIIEGYWGNGWDIHGSETDGTTSTCFANNITIRSCKGRGVYIRGDNANAGNYMNMDIRDCGKAGVKDASFLGNKWDSIMCHFNGWETFKLPRKDWEGNFMALDVNNHSTFVGCYSEEGSPPSLFKGCAAITGGLHGYDRFILENYATAQCEGLFAYAPYDESDSYVKRMLNQYKTA